MSSSLLKPLSARWFKYTPLLLLLAARLALGLAYSQVVPAWESYDEDGHFAYVHYLAQHHRLTLSPEDPDASQIWEKFQPPLYYDLIAPAIALFDHEPSFRGPERNPYFTAGDAGVNYALHGGVPNAAELALRAARVTGVVISTLSVIAVFLTAKKLWPKERATIWAATILYAFWPQFVYVGSMVTNDVLVTALAAVAVWLAVNLTLDGFRLWRALALSALVGAGLLTKLNGAALIMLAGGALLLSLRPGRGALNRVTGSRLLLGLGGLAGLIGIALWTLSSLNFVTGQVFRLVSLRDFASYLSPGIQPVNHFIMAALAYAFRTFLASYGWGNLESFSWLYPLWLIGTLLAVAGFVPAFWRRHRDRVLEGPPARVYFLLGVFVLSLVGLAMALAISQQSVYLVPGRYLLPALPAVVILLVGGWRAWLPISGQRRIAWQAISLGLILVGWLVPFRILVPAYARPRPDTSGKIDTPASVLFGDGIEFLGYDGPIQAVAGNSLKATLCWQAIVPTTADDTLFLEVVGADGQGYGRLRTYPGHGNYPTSQWALNTPFCESYQVPLGDKIPAPALAHLRVSWQVGTTTNPLPVRQLSGPALDDSAFSLEFKVAGQPGVIPPVANVTDFRFGQQIELTGYETTAESGAARVTLRWQALDDISTNYVVFTHLRDTPDHAYGQGDSLPLAGAYPTWLWKKGEVILDPHVLQLPAGGATPPLALYVGMYDAATHQRLAVFDSSGHEIKNSEVILAQRLSFP